MKKFIKIYAVKSSKGLYDCYTEWIERCFTKWDDADEWRKVVDISHKWPNVIPDEVMDDLEAHFYSDFYNPAVDEFCKEYNIPTGIANIQRTESQRAKIICFTDRLEENYDNWCKKYLVEHYPEYTAQDYDKQIEVNDHKYDDWHPCEIEELDLVVDDDFKNTL